MTQAQMSVQERFTKIATYVKSLDRKGGQVWQLVAEYVKGLACPDEEIRQHFAEAEEDVKKAHKVTLASNATYRSAKAVALKARENGVPLLDENGKARGKSEIEGENKAIKQATAPEKEGEEEGETATISNVERLILAWGVASEEERMEFLTQVGLVAPAEEK